MLCEEAKRIDVVGLCGLSPPYLPGSLHIYGAPGWRISPLLLRCSSDRNLKAVSRSS